MQNKLEQQNSEPIGFSTMSTQILKSYNYHNWIFNTIKPYLLDNILEVGAGHGIYTEFLSKMKKKIIAADIDSKTINYLSDKFFNDSNVEILNLNFEDKSSVTQYHNRTDTILLINILEHVKNDHLFAQNCYQILKKNSGGKIIIYVPAFNFLFGEMDKLAGHYQRYSKKSLVKVMTSAGFQTVTAKYVNFIGLIGWLINKTFFKPKDISEQYINQQIKLFDQYIIPIAKMIDPLMARFAGQSLFYVGEIN